MSSYNARDFIAYNRLREKLLNLSVNPNHSFELTSKPFDENPTQHHYIPKHFIEGFLDGDGLLWRYDKAKDRIVKNKQGSKGVFFEKFRNSVEVAENIYQPLFEHYYTIMDNLFPIAIRLLREKEDINNELALELYEHLNIFLIDLYWRNINTDKIFDQIFDGSSISLTGFNLGTRLSGIQNDLKIMPGVKQLVRIQIVQETMRNAMEYLKINANRYSLVQFNECQLCLGDMPFVLGFQPTKHTDLISLPMMAPISSMKLYLRNMPAGTLWGPMETSMLNALTIHYSSKMVVCANKQILELAINTYHSAKDKNLFPYVHNRLFSV